MTLTTDTPGPRFRDLETQDLALRARAGSLAAMNELVARFESRLLSFLVRRTGSRCDAEDLAQETFVRAWRRIDRYDPRWQFSTWLFTIGGRLAITHHRSARRAAPEIASALASAGRDRSAGDEPSRAVAVREECEHIWRLADRLLTGTQRAALWLRYAEGLDAGAIGRILGRTGISIRVTLLRARRILAEHEHAPRPRGVTTTATPGASARFGFRSPDPRPAAGKMGGES